MIESRTCLLPMVTQQSEYMLRLHQHYQNRVLPFAGGILEQPHYYVESMEIIEAADRKIQREMHEREMAKKRGGKGLRELMDG